MCPGLNTKNRHLVWKLRTKLDSVIKTASIIREQAIYRKPNVFSLVSRLCAPQWPHSRIHNIHSNSLCLSLYISFSVSLPLSPCLSPSLSVYLPLSLSISLSLSVSLLPLSLSISLFLCFSLSLSLSLSLSVSSLPLSLSPPPLLFLCSRPQCFTQNVTGPVGPVTPRINDPANLLGGPTNFSLPQEKI